MACFAALRRSRLQNKRPLASLDDADHCIVDRRRHAERLAEPRDRSVDGVDLAAPAGVVIQQHRGPRAGNLAAELADVLDGIADNDETDGEVRKTARSVALLLVKKQRAK